MFLNALKEQDSSAIALVSLRSSQVSFVLIFVSSVQDVNIVSLHASRQCVFVCTISDLCKFFIANQMVRHITIIKGVIVHTGLSSDEVGDCLGVLACDN